jgi:hypothetical protein
MPQVLLSPPAIHTGSITLLPSCEDAGRQILKCEKKVPSTSAGSRQDLTPAVFWNRLTGILAFPARKFLRTSHARKMPERAKIAAFEGFWQAKVF